MGGCAGTHLYSWHARIHAHVLAHHLKRDISEAASCLKPQMWRAAASASPHESLHARP
jgi:hypothetical protein